MKKTVSVLILLSALCLIFCSCTKDEHQKNEESSQIERGVAEITSYTNDFIGMKFNLPDNRRFLTESELASLMNMTQELATDKDIFEKSPSVFEFMAVQMPDNQNNINLVIENLKLTGSEKISLEDYSKAFKEAVVKQCPDFDYSFGEDSTAKLGDEEYPIIESTCTYGNVSMKQFTCLRKVGGYMISIGPTSGGKMTAAQFEDMFS